MSLRRNKKDKFAVLLEKISTNLKEATEYFVDFKLHTVDDTQTFAEKMKEFESIGDSYVHETITELNNSFITPIEREDILALSMKMDDVLDGMEHTVAAFDMYLLSEVDEYMLQFVDLINKSVEEIDQAITLVFSKKLPEVSPHAIRIKDYESQCDAILRKSIKHLFSTETDAVNIIKYKAIYEELEVIADSCEKVAITLDSIVMKNA